MVFRIAAISALIFFNPLLVDYGSADRPVPLPEWQIKGFKAALNDPYRGTFVTALEYMHRHSILVAMAEADKDLAPLLGQRLSDTDAKVREATVESLRVLGHHAKDQAPLLGQRLSDEAWRVREAAARALGALGEHAKDQVPLLIERLSDDDSDVRVAAVESLGVLREHAKDQASSLGKLLSDEDPNVREASARTLGALGQHAKDQARLLGQLLSDGDSDVREASARTLGALGEHAKDQVPLLIERLSDGDLDVREAAVEALGVLREYAKDQASSLGKLLNDEDPNVRVSAARALGALGEHAKDQAPLLGQRISDTDAKVREATVESLRALGEHAKDQAPLLGQRLMDNAWSVRVAAARALGAFGEHAKDQVPLLIERLSDRHSGVRRAAVESLKALGEHAKDQASSLGQLLRDDAWKVRRAAAQVLGALGEHAKDQASLLVERLRDDNQRVRWAASKTLEALGEHAKDQALLLGQQLSNDDAGARAAAALALRAFGEHAKDQAPLLGQLLSDEDPDVRWAAARALGALGKHAKDQARLLGQLLSDGDPDVREAAAQALGSLGEHAEAQLPLLGQLLNDDDPDMRWVAANALKALGEHAKAQVPSLGQRLSDEDTSVREAAVEALGELGEHAKDQVQSLGQLLSDDEAGVRVAAAEALGALGEHAKDQAPLLGQVVSDGDSELREAAVRALGALGVHAKDQSLLLVDRLSDDDGDVRYAAVEALVGLAPMDIVVAPAIITHHYGSWDRTAEVRFLTHLVGGGGEQVEVFLRWLPGLRGEPLRAAKVDHQWALTSLRVFDSVWPHTESYREVRQEVERLAAELVSEVNWNVEDLGLLEAIEARFSAIGSTQAAAVKEKILKIKSKTWGLFGLSAILAHMAFWAALIFAYPRYVPVQAIFFWNKWVRRIAGFGYVGFLLTWVPFLRQRLFAPFIHSLLADARLAELHEEDYFRDSLVERPDGTQLPITAAIPQILGQIILEGESGLGKSMFLRHLVRDYQRLVVFLRAGDCSSGVLEAVQAKLEGPARDADYLRKLVYAGAIDVVIDGLNEVSADTRATIVEFSRRFLRGNLLLATQPMEWDPPPLAKIYALRPLADEQIETFLIGRLHTLQVESTSVESNNSSGLSAEQFAKRCQDYVRGSLNGQLPKSTLDAARTVLSNPMDLTIVAQMLVHDQTPNLFELQQQHFRLMAEDYEQRYSGNAFPLNAFAERVYEMRLEDQPTFRENEFANELAAMARFKMIVPYHELAMKADAAPLWTFRHDKIMDFFLVQAFLGPGNERPLEHLGDPRFRGTYLQLANLLPLEAAKDLERQLVDYAADSKDHSVSDDFIQLLRPRKVA